MKKRTAKSYSVLAIDITLASDYFKRFRENLLERISKLIMTMYKITRSLHMVE